MGRFVGRFRDLSYIVFRSFRCRSIYSSYCFLGLRILASGRLFISKRSSLERVRVVKGGLCLFGCVSSYIYYGNIVVRGYGKDRVGLWGLRVVVSM